MSERVLLAVDDDPNVLRSLVRLLRRDGYRILTAESGEAALACLAQNPGVQVILSDQRMPFMSGAQFFARASCLYPATVRLMLSGYSDAESVTECLQKGTIDKFLSKPWDDDVLRDEVLNAFARYESRAEEPPASNPTAPLPIGTPGRPS